MSETIGPAMTAEEWGWEGARAWASDVPEGVPGRGYAVISLQDDATVTLETGVLTSNGEREPEGIEHLDEEDCHKIAALALYGQPFGFTQDDVYGLREREASCRENATRAAETMQRDRYQDAIDAARFFGDLVNRIAALLPPEANDE